MSKIWTEKRKALALAEAERWRGVAHQPNMAVFPTGIDCINYMNEIMVAAGIYERRPIPEYKFETEPEPEDLIETELEKHFHVELLDMSHEVQFGDVAVFRKGVKLNGHCGFLDGVNCYQSLGGHIVTKSRWQHWRHKAKLLVRFHEIGWK
jgi:hypothetical protein